MDLGNYFVKKVSERKVCPFKGRDSRSCGPVPIKSSIASTFMHRNFQGKVVSKNKPTGR